MAPINSFNLRETRNRDRLRLFQPRRRARVPINRTENKLDPPVGLEEAVRPTGNSNRSPPVDARARATTWRLAP